MQKIFWFVAGLLYVNFSVAASDSTCNKEFEGKQSCHANKTVKCMKNFDPKSVAMKYEWNEISFTGISLNIHSPQYGKLAGYSPLPCTDAHVAKDGGQNATAAN